MKLNFRFRFFRPIYLLIIPAFYLFVAGYLFFNQKRMLYFPSEQIFGPCKQIPDAAVVQEGQVRFLELKKTEKVALLFHGNTGSACDRAAYAEFFTMLGYSSIFVEYPGFTLNDGEPERKRTLSMIEELGKSVAKRKYKEVVLVGESLGSALGAYYARLFPVDLLILVTPFDSLTNVVQEKYKLFPAKILFRETYDTLEWAKDVERVRIVYAGEDVLVPPKYAKSLFDQLPTKDKQFLEIKGVGHNSIFDAPEYWHTLATLLR